MASDRQTPAVELLSQVEAGETSPSVDNKKELVAQQTVLRSSVTPPQDSSLQASQNKNAVAPKRLSTIVKRRPAATPAASSRSNPSSTSHTAPSSGLSKPPTRPLPSSTARRPAFGVTAATAASPGYKKRASVSSADTYNKGDTSASEENKKPSTNQTNSRLSTVESRKSISEWPSTTRKAPLPSLNNMDKKSTLSQNNSSPIKTYLKSTTNNSRPGNALTSSQSNRPVASSTRTTTGLNKTDGQKKRLSTIPASPAVQQAESAPSEQLLSPPTPLKSARPGLGTRKSTMSVTIEQRLREMELVHRMLHIAMAEDGGEDDEVKEEYGRKVDESLASLRTKLEEARRSEGLDGAVTKNDGSDRAAEAGGSKEETSELSKAVEDPEASFLESQSKIAKLNAALSALQSSILHRSIPPQDALLTNTETLEVLQRHEEHAERCNNKHNSEIEELRTSHQNELTAAHSLLQEVEDRHKDSATQLLKDLDESNHKATMKRAKEAASLLESEVQKHSSKYEALERQLANEKTSGREEAIKVQRLMAEMSNLQEELIITQRKLNNNEFKLDQQQADFLQEKNQLMIGKDQIISTLQVEIEELQATHTRKLEEAESASQAQMLALASELVTLREKIHNLESDQELDKGLQEENLEAKGREITHLSKVIEDFQTQMQQLHEMKEREIDETKVDLIQEHEKMILDLHRKHHEDTETAVVNHERELRHLNEDLKTCECRLEKTVSELGRSLEQSERALEESKLASTAACVTIETLNKKLRVLESEKEEVERAKQSIHEAFEQSSSEVLSLKRSLDTIGNESCTKDEQHAATIKDLTDKLDATAQLLEHKSVEAASAFETQAKELQKVRDSYDKEMEEFKEGNARVNEVLQNDYSKLLASWQEAEKEHPLALERVKANHEEAIKKHVEQLEELRIIHLKDIDELKCQTERRRSQDILSITTSHTDEASKAEKKFQRDIDELQQQHEKRYISLRKELEDAETERSLTAQNAHEAVLSDLHLQLQHHQTLVADMEKQLEEARQTKEHQPNPELEEAEQKIEALQIQLGSVQSDASQAKDEVTRLVAIAEEASIAMINTAELDCLRQEMSELIRKHEAEMSKIHETMSLESERREKERKQGAEVRDRLVAESERMRLELLEVNDQLQEHQSAMQVSTTQVQEANHELSAARQAVERYINDYQKAAEEVIAAHTEIEKLKLASLATQTEDSTGAKQELEALQIAAEAERKLNAKLEEQLREARALSEKHATRVREIESALKVTTAELVELQTERPNGSSYVASPAPKSGLRSSRWAVADHDRQQEDGSAGDNDELGSRIEGDMAGLQEQVRQLDDMNEDMLSEAKRLVDRLEIDASFVEKMNLPSSMASTAGEDDEMCE